MRRILVILIALALLPAAVHAQQSPGALQDPAQVDPGITQAVSDFVATQSYSYAGDCGLFIPGADQLCSEVFVSDGGTVSFALLDVQNVLQVAPQLRPLDDGSWIVSADSSSSAAPIAAPASVAVTAPVSAPAPAPGAVTAPVSAPLPVSVPAARPATAPSVATSGAASLCAKGFIPSPGNGRGPTLCRDGLCSHSAGRGTCSDHGGIAMRVGAVERLVA